MREHLIDPLREHGVIPVIRTPSAKLANRAVEWLNDAGFQTFELTAWTNGITDLVSEISSDMGLDVGVGMVKDPRTASACIEAGASYIGTPGIADGIVEICREADVACLLGAATPSEVMKAFELGADCVRIFPACTLGGAPYIKTLAAAFPNAQIAPARGIGVDDIAEYLKAGAAFVGVGRKLVDAKSLCSGDKDAIIDTAANALDQVAAVRSQSRARKRYGIA